MTAVDYQPFIERLIQRYEGGYGWDRSDPGGPTKYGITCYDLAEHRHEHMDSKARWAPIVWAMTLKEADDIYANKYATACAFTDLKSGSDCVVLDFGVNSGPSRAVKYAQRIVGTKVDGQLGPLTVRAINGYPSAKFINELCDNRLTFLQNLGIWSTFGRGWTARIKDLRGYSLGLLHSGQVGAALHHKKLSRIPLAFAKGWE
jgi:lysozyme family protein